MATLKFDAVAVGQRIAHANRSTEWSKGFGQTGSAEPSLIFVKDDGIYVMSNGIPGQTDEATGRQVVVYAKGYDPRDGDVWDKCRDAVGGDDFAEFVEVSALEPIPEDARYLVIRVSTRSMSFAWETATRPAKV